MVSSHGRFAWYELVTTDVRSAKAFYTDVMGWGTREASVAGRAYTFFTVGPDSIGGLLHLPEEARRRGGSVSWVGYVEVDDVDATADRVNRLGGTVYVPPVDIAGISRISVFADPQAATLALLRWLRPGHQRSEKADEPGRVGWHELLAADREKAFAFYREVFGWQSAGTQTGASDDYQPFSAGGQTIGGILAKTRDLPAPFWLYYFKCDDLDAAAKRVTAAGGRILVGPVRIPGGGWMVQCADPQGAVFGLEGQRRKRA